MKKIAILLAFLTLGSVFAMAEEEMQHIIIRPRPRPPVIFFRLPSNDRSIPMKMTSLKASVEVVGKLAVTTYDMTFYNDNQGVLEGEFVFPLGEGQTVSRFAMDVNGRLREGVVVEKDKGRQVFDSVVRSMIDPGLLEWTKGNTFRARIYPIPAKGYKRVLVAWEQELDEAGSAGLLYRLPLAFSDTVENFSLDVTVIEQELAPQLDSANELANLTFNRWNKAFLAKFERTNYVPDKQLSFIVPRTPMTKTVVVETDPSGKKYFTAMGAIGGIITPKQIAPKRILILQDVSASMAGRDKVREWALIERWLQTTRDGAEIRLIQFSHAIHTEKLFNKKDRSRLRDALDKAFFDGGTSLGAIDLTKYQADACILLTDGISNFGSDELKTARYPIYAITSQLTSEHALLRRMTDITGGAYLNLARMTDAEAAARMTGVVPRILSITGRGLRDVYPSAGAPLASIATFAGILDADEGELLVRYGTELAPRELRIPISSKTSLATTTNGIVRRIWAQKKIADLETQWSKNEAEIIKLAKTFGIVTRGTSLIVLDRIEDYVRHRIVPPAELHAAYYTAISEIDKKKVKIEADHIEDVVRRFALLQGWYDKRFPKDTPPSRPENKKAQAEGANNRDGLTQNYSTPRSTGARDTMEENQPSGLQSDSEQARQPSTQARSKNNGQAGAEGAIELKKWTPDVPYLKELEKADKDERYPVYLGLRAQWAKSSAFFLDVADFFAEKGEKETALRVLSNIAEMELENPQLLRILGHRLAQLGWLELAEKVFAAVLAMKPEDPQSYRDLGLVLERAGKSQRAVELLYEVATKKWDSRFPDIELIALVELNGIISRGTKIDISKLDRRVIRAMPTDVRVVLNWDADNCDMDLWVTDPNREKCYYANKLTYQGGRLSKDFTRGYGPEEYLVRDAKSGNYAIEVNYYGNTQQTIAGATTVQLQLFLNWGRPNQVVKEITLRLKDSKEVIKVGTFTIDGGQIKLVK